MRWRYRIALRRYLVEECIDRRRSLGFTSLWYQFDDEEVEDDEVVDEEDEDR